jgi:hypothetical protein
MTNPAVFIGEPLKFKDKFFVYPPKVKEVVANPSFGQFLKVLTITQEDIRDELVKKEDGDNNYPTPFEFLLINCYHSQEFQEITKEAFRFFIRDEITFVFE